MKTEKNLTQKNIEKIEITLNPRLCRKGISSIRLRRSTTGFPRLSLVGLTSSSTEPCHQETAGSQVCGMKAIIMAAVTIEPCDTTKYFFLICVCAELSD